MPLDVNAAWWYLLNSKPNQSLMRTSARLLVWTLGLLSGITARAQQHIDLVPGQHTNCNTAVLASEAWITVDRVIPQAGAAENRAATSGCMWIELCLHPPPQTKVFISITNTTPNGDLDDVFGYLLDPSFCGAPRCPMFVPGPPPPEAILIDDSSQPTITLTPGTYYLYVEYDPAVTSFEVTYSNYLVDCEPVPLDCPDCLSTFSPIPGEQYRVSAWVSKDDLSPGATTIFQSGSPFVQVECPPGTNLVEGLAAVSPIIDGWQLIEGSFTMPQPDPEGDPLSLFVNLGATSGVSYFDDVRIYPDDASMKSYVYDPINLRFVAELDERHFTTFYEYDPEGRLVRVKKETERGVMTIKETRQNTAKQTAP